MPAEIFADGDQDYIEKFNTVAQQAFDGDAAAGRLDDHIDGTADKHGASAIVNTPAGSIAATDVQAAINELDTEKQPIDATLTALAGVTTAADKLIYATGADTFGTTDLTSAGRALLDDADASAQRTTLGLGTAATLASDTDTTLAANSDTRLATQKAVKAYVDALIAASDAVVFRGVTDCSANPNYPAADAGHLYIVSVAGKIGGASGVTVEAGDMFICKVDGTASGNQATVGANWGVVQTNINGALTTADIGTTVQAYDADLAAIAGLTSAANKLPYFSGSGTAALADFTSAGRALVDDADAQAQRATLAIPVVSSADFASLAAAVTSVIASGKALMIGPSETATINVPSDVSTIQGAINATRNWIVSGGGQIVIQLADGTYTTGGSICQPLGGANQGVIPLTIQGNSSTPGNVIVSTTSEQAFQAQFGGVLNVQDMELRTTTAGSCLYATTGSVIRFNNIRFGATAKTHIEAVKGGVCESLGNYAITGGGLSHMHAANGGRIFNSGNTVTISGTPAFSAYFIGVAGPGYAQCIGQTYSGSATGQRFLVHNGGFIELGNVSGAYTDPASSTYFPGDVAGYCNPSTGGVYDYILNGFVSASFLAPLTSDGAALGSASKMWSDLFLASGAVLNWNNGNVTLTHSANALALSGAAVSLSSTLAVNGAATGSSFQVKTDSNLTVRMISSGGVNLVDGVNQAQNAYMPIRLSGSTASLAASNTDHVTVNGTRVVMGSPVGLKSYTVATLPTGAAGDFAYASDGRKNGEGAAAGTGVPVFKDGSAWRAVDTGATVAA